MKEIVDKVDVRWGELPFDYVKTDCHLEYWYRDGKWDDGKVVEDDQLTISMASTCLHYGQECFEGLKVFETKDGRVLAFRTEQNAKRMKRTAEKILMTPFPGDMFIEAVDRVVRLNKRFIPPYGSGASLYVRPLLLGVTGTVGIKPSREYLFVVFCSPVGPYFKTGLQPIKLLVEETIDRASPNGVGDVKASGNYAAGLRATHAAKAKGFDEVLYVDAVHKHYIDESGAANFFGITQDGKYVTPVSTSILTSITNESLKVLAEDMGIPVEARQVHIEELFDFAEAGCCGTAAIVAPVESITYRDQVITYRLDGNIGPISRKLYDGLTGIQSGDLQDKFAWTREIDLED